MTTRNIVPIYPIYLVDREGFVFRCPSAEAAQRNIERMDIVTDEYVGWDSDGRELELALEGGQGVVVTVAATTRIEVGKVLALVRAALVKSGFPNDPGALPADFLTALKLASNGKYYDQ